MAFQENVGQQASGTLSLQDTVTGNAVSATFSNVTATPDQPSIYSATVNADGSITAVGIAPGNGVLTFGATVAYSDSTGTAQTANLTGTIPVQIAQAAADAVALVLTFGTPTAVVTPAAQKA